VIGVYKCKAIEVEGVLEPEINPIIESEVLPYDWKINEYSKEEREFTVILKAPLKTHIKLKKFLVNFIHEFEDIVALYDKIEKLSR